MNHCFSYPPSKVVVIPKKENNNKREGGTGDFNVCKLVEQTTSHVPVMKDKAPKVNRRKA